MPQMIYLDHNATTPPLPEVIEEVTRVMRDCFGNPGSRHREGRKARQILEECRENIAGRLGALPSELIFTSGGTESNNLALRGLADVATPHQAAAGPGDPSPVIVISPGEHPSIAQVCRALAERGWQSHQLPVDSSGRLQFKDLPATTRLAAVILAHNETGAIQDIKPLAETCRSNGIPLHLDAVQAVGKIPVNFRSLAATTLSFGAHKFHGPRGIGGLLIKEGTKFSPLHYGGHQEAARRAGTEPVPLIAGMALALELWQQRQAWHSVRLEQLRDHFQTVLCDRCSPAVVNGIDAWRLPNTLNISFPGVDGEALLVALDLDGIACSLGTTCASGATEPAPILVAMGLTTDLYRSAVRFSLSFLNTHAELEEAADRIARVVAALRKPA